MLAPLTISLFYSTASPSSRITCTISSTYFAHNSSLCASTITRITGSVPLSRRRILPSSPKAALIRSFSACTCTLPVTAALSSTFTFFKSCGYICIPLHSVPRLCFFSRITSISINAVRIPSPVVACLLKMICPDCSPPSTYPLATIASLTYLSPTVVTHTSMPSRFIALNNPMLDMIVTTTVLFCRRPHSPSDTSHRHTGYNPRALPYHSHPRQCTDPFYFLFNFMLIILFTIYLSKFLSATNSS